jgi:DNA polymerase-1
MYGANWTQDQRIRAKAVNFGIPYGREAFSIAEEFDIPVSEAQRLIDAWFARAPEATAFLKRARSAPSQGRTLITVFGRKRRPGVVSAERAHGLMNEFANFNMQSPISDFTLHSGIQMLPRLKREGAMIVNLIHDSVLTEFPDDSLEREQQVAGIVKETMESVPKQWIRTPIVFRVDIKVGTHWGLLKAVT